MVVDLHTHSTASDGSDPPETLIRRGAELGLRAIALTDHDTLEGIDRARVAAEQTGTEVIPGTELSLEWEKGGMHLVVLWLEPGAGPLQDQLAGLQAGRNVRNARIVDRLRHLGLDISLADIEQEAGEGSVGRPHFAAVMLRKGYVPDLATAFDEYLGNGRPAYVPRPRLTPERALHLSLASGGVPILAHPHTLGIDNRFEMADLLERLVDAGLVGIECHYGTYEAAGRSGMEAMARRFGLVPAGGSDYHGTYKPDVELGTGKVGLATPDHVLEELRQARARRE